MNEAHQPYCDHNHTPRQRCNRARAVEPAPPERIIDVPHSAQPASGPAANGRSAPADSSIDDPRAAAVRESVATADVTAPTEFVSREWSRTTGAVEQAYRSPTTASARPAERHRPGPAIAFVGAAISLVVLLVLVARRRSEGRQLTADR